MEKTEDRWKPFSGKQIIIVGDFAQLRPIPNIFDDRSSMFISVVFRESITHRFELKTSFRQNNAKDLLLALQDLRLVECSEESARLLRSLDRPIENEDEAFHVYFSQSNFTTLMF